MKSLSKNVLLVGATVGALVSSTFGAYALGTAAGTSVTNTISVSYESAGSTITTPNADTVSFFVDRKIDFAVEGQDAGKTVTVAQAQEGALLVFEIDNQSNSDLEIKPQFLASPTSAPIGLVRSNTATTTDGEYYIVRSDDATFDPSDPVLSLDPATGESTYNIPVDDEVYYIVVANINTTVGDGATDLFQLVALAWDGAVPLAETGNPTLGTVDVIFTDPDEDGMEFDSETMVVSAPDLLFSKTFEVLNENREGTETCDASVTVDTTGGVAGSIPGACVRYVISVTNDAGASGSAVNLMVTDSLPPEFKFEEVTSATFDNVSEAGGTVSGSHSQLDPGDVVSLFIYGEIE